MPPGTESGELLPRGTYRCNKSSLTSHLLLLSPIPPPSARARREGEGQLKQPPHLADPRAPPLHLQDGRDRVESAHRAAVQIEAGLVWVNTHHRNDPSSPWYPLSILSHQCGFADIYRTCRGGMKESGIGRENGLEAFEACEWQTCRQYTI